MSSQGTSSLAGTLWVDLDNTPHVPFFRPIIRELGRRGHRVVCTARQAFQVCELAAHYGLQAQPIGRHHGPQPLAKVCGLFWRAIQLLPHARRTRPDLAISHGSRAQILAAHWLRIPTVLLEDYEFAQYPPLMRPRWELLPEAIPVDRACCAPHRVRRYPGFKEDVYVPEFAPDPALGQELGLNGSQTVVTVRPPATEAHYHNPESETLLEAVMEFLLRQPTVKVVLLPRNSRQAVALRQAHPPWFATNQVAVPAQAVDGLNLIWHSDLLISGGGTMNREAAALGVPVYSIFRGRIGAVDRELERQGRLVFIQHPAEVSAKIRLTRRDRSPNIRLGQNRTLRIILDHLEDILRRERTA